MIGIIGDGKTGRSVAKFLDKTGKEYLIFDENKKDSSDVISKFDIDILEKMDSIIISPGISKYKFENINKKIISEIELAFLNNKGKILAVTGTNGKTTTVSLLYHLVQGSFDKEFLVGNIGKPFIDIVDETTDNSVVVLETSSFQLETIDKFAPNVSCILNLTPDHLDRHFNMANYLNEKIKITINQTKDDILVLNLDDPYLVNINTNAQKKYFSLKDKNCDAYLSGEDIIIKNYGKLCNVKELKLLGEHNYQNVMAAVLMAIACGVEFDIIKNKILTFESVKHRLQFISEVDGVKYYNDSKATNPDSTIKAIEAIKDPIVLILGGSDKNSDFEELFSKFDKHIVKLIFMGDVVEKLVFTANKFDYKNYYIVNNLDEAFELSKKISEIGDVVLLSPACASFNEFKNYEERGEKFIERVING